MCYDAMVPNTGRILYEILEFSFRDGLGMGLARGIEAVDMLRFWKWKVIQCCR